MTKKTNQNQLGLPGVAGEVPSPLVPQGAEPLASVPPYARRLQGMTPEVPKTVPFPVPPAPEPIAVPARPTATEVLAARVIKPRRRRGAPGPADVEGALRDDALDALEAARAALVVEAHKIAVQLARQRGRVTSVEVWHALLAYGYEEQMKGYDARWLGCVFRRGWRRVGIEPTGSHKRMVSVWTLA